MIPFAVEPVEPVGKEATVAFVTRVSGCSLQHVDVLVYPPHPEGERMREARVSRSLRLRDVAAALGMKAPDYSGLEMGRMRFVDPTDWQRAMDVVERAACPAGAPEEPDTSPEYGAAGGGHQPYCRSYVPPKGTR